MQPRAKTKSIAIYSQEMHRFDVPIFYYSHVLIQESVEAAEAPIDLAAGASDLAEQFPGQDPSNINDGNSDTCVHSVSHKKIVFPAISPQNPEAVVDSVHLVWDFLNPNIVSIQSSNDLTHWKNHLVEQVKQVDKLNIYKLKEPTSNKWWRVVIIPSKLVGKKREIGGSMGALCEMRLYGRGHTNVERVAGIGTDVEVLNEDERVAVKNILDRVINVQVVYWS